MQAMKPEDWQSVGAIATAVGVLVALAGVVVTLIFTIRSEKLTRAGQKTAQEQAEAAAQRSEAAARLTEEYTRRLVDAVETMAKNGGLGTAASPGVRWSLRFHQGDSYLLENVGDRIAHKVQVESHESLVLRKPPVQDVAPSAAIKFIAARSMATSDSTITVRWTDDGEEASWKYPLPPKNPR
ncbi:hypothetical protein AB0M47_00900 [Hamadaea sp. NPDC051192]|uniref:hypothetical protein n=1 Tax=Hamadaea sp. NPDC051192 TaxID=3154940 RepID=UPI00341D3558